MTGRGAVQVPEISAATKPAADPAALLDRVKRGQAVVGKKAAVPMLIGPVTMARLAQLEGISISQCSEMLLPAYSQLLSELKKLQVLTVLAATSRLWLYTCDHGYQFCRKASPMAAACLSVLQIGFLLHPACMCWFNAPMASWASRLTIHTAIVLPHDCGVSS